MKLVTKNPDTSVNVSKKSEVATFFWYIGFFIMFFVALLLVFREIGYIATLFISLEKEKEIFSTPSKIFTIDEEKTKKLHSTLGIKEERIYVVNSSEENAFAGLGGHIYITDALLDTIQYKNELLFIIGHEKSHIQQRDVFISIVSEMPISILVALIQGQTDVSLNSFQSSIINFFSKNTELRADKEGVDFVQSRAGEVGCVGATFERETSWLKQSMTFLSDHPMDTTRIQILKKYSETKNYKEKSPCTPFTF